MFKSIRKTVWKTRKRIRKTIRNATEKILASLRPTKNFSPPIFHQILKVFHRPKFAQKKSFFSPRGSAGGATLTDRVRVGFWQKGFFADFYFEPPDSSPILSPKCFSSFLWGKGAQKKILQENPQQSYTTRIPDSFLHSARPEIDTPKTSKTCTNKRKQAKNCENDRGAFCCSFLAISQRSFSGSHLGFSLSMRVGCGIRPRHQEIEWAKRSVYMLFQTIKLQHLSFGQSILSAIM